MHISEQVASELVAQGWKANALRDRFEKIIEGFEEAGTVSNGRRLVYLRICDAGRWFERVDGWHYVQREVDLRDFANDPAGAIKAVLA